MSHVFRIFMVFLLFIQLSGCDKNSVSDQGEHTLENGIINGKGSFTFDGYAPLEDKPLKVFYYIPKGSSKEMPILMVFHGAGRNAEDYRDAWVEEADRHKIILIAPEFSESTFPGGSGYNLGNVFENGNQPSANTLNPESEWTFALIDPLFDKVKELTDNERNSFDIYGHSAGGQFAHRLVLFEPQVRFNRVVIAASGWYTLADFSVDFPYGIGKTPLEKAHVEAFYTTNLIIQVGSLDSDPNSFNLRHNPMVDKQGNTRLERAYYFFEQSRMKAENEGILFNWALLETPDTRHEFEPTIEQAAHLLYESDSSNN